MQQLDKSEQMILARGFFKSSEAAKTLGESCSQAQESLRRRHDKFFRTREQYQIVQQLKTIGQTAEASVAFEVICADAAKILCDTDCDDEQVLSSQLDAIFRSVPPTFEEQIAARKQTGEKVKFVSKSKLRKAMVAKFIEAFGPQCVKMQIGLEWDPLFYMRCCGWFVVTQLWFGRQQSLISCRHIVESETRIQHPQNPKITGPAMTLTPAIAWPCSGQWEHLMDGDVELACNAAIKHCGYLFEAAPRLLKGLEFENITAN